jgi:hypothetical protein
VTYIEEGERILWSKEKKTTGETMKQQKSKIRRV